MTKEPDETFGLDDLIGYNLKRAYVLAEADFRRSLGEGGLAPRVFAALSHVVGHPGITQSALARRLGIERSGLVAIVDDLEGRGHVTRKAIKGDRRAQALVPTADGRDAFDKAMRAVRAHEDRLFSMMTAAERKTLLALLSKVRSLEDAPDA